MLTVFRVMLLVFLAIAFSGASAETEMTSEIADCFLESPGPCSS